MLIDLRFEMEDLHGKKMISVTVFRNRVQYSVEINDEEVVRENAASRKTGEKWMTLMEDMRLDRWKSSYLCPEEFCEGQTVWKLFYQTEDKGGRTIQGINAYPGCWNSFIEVMDLLAPEAGLVAKNSLVQVVLAYQKLVEPKAGAVCEYTENLVIDRQQGCLIYEKHVGDLCVLHHEYGIEEEIASLLKWCESYFDTFDPLDILSRNEKIPTISILLTREEGEPEEFKRCYNQDGLPETWGELMERISDFMTVCGPLGEMFDESAFRGKPEEAEEKEENWESKLKVAIIGMGGMGKKYSKMILEHEHGPLALVAVCCRSAQTKQWVKENLPDQVFLADNVEKLYEHEELFDAVLITTPHKSHAELAVQAFAHGKHVLCEKPADVSVKKSLMMNQAAEESGCVFAMMFHQRLYQKYRRIKEILSSGALGRIQRVLMVNTRYFRTEHYHKSGTWRSSWTGEGGGVLINQGQHILDIWQWLFGMPESVYAEIPFGKYNSFSVDDEATLFMEYPDHMTGVFILTTGEGSCEERLEISGERGRLVLEEEVLHVFSYEDDLSEYRKEATCNAREELTEHWHAEEYPVVVEPYWDMLKNFACATAGMEPVVVDGREGLGALMIANAAYLSAWKKEKIHLPIHSQEYEEELQKRIEEEQKKEV